MKGKTTCLLQLFSCRSTVCLHFCCGSTPHLTASASSPLSLGVKKNKEWENKRSKPWFRVTISSCDHLKPWGLKSEKSHYKEDFIHTVSVILSSAVYVHGSYSSKLQDSSVYVDFQLFCLVNNACLQLQRCTILIFSYFLKIITEIFKNSLREREFTLEVTLSS